MPVSTNDLPSALVVRLRLASLISVLDATTRLHPSPTVRPFTVSPPLGFAGWVAPVPHVYTVCVHQGWHRGKTTNSPLAKTQVTPVLHHFVCLTINVTIVYPGAN